MKMAKKYTKYFLNMENRRHCKSHDSKLRTNDDMEINYPVLFPFNCLIYISVALVILMFCFLFCFFLINKGSTVIG